jgi:glyoxylate carboligase
MGRVLSACVPGTPCVYPRGVDTVFGLPGDGINGVFEALRKHREQIRFIRMRHEEGAAFMACAYAKFTCRVGVCIATSGPGGIHLLNRLYDAKMDHAPVLAITGLQHSDLIGTFTQLDVALDIEDAATCGAQLDSVMGRPEPVLIEALVDPFTPPLPAKIRTSQALKLAEALVRGEPNRMKIALTNAHDTVRELV